MTSMPARLAAVTGDPSLPDPTKHGQAYGPEDLEVHRQLEEALRSIGRFEYRVFERHDGLFEALAGFAPELVLNFCDTGLFNRPEQEIHLPARLELLGLPYSGAAPRGILVCYDKQIVRLVAQSLGFAVAAERFVAAADVATAEVDALPALIKPNLGDGSVGITGKAVVETPTEASDYLAWLAAELPGRDVLIQEYLPGPEFGLGLIGNAGTGFQALPMLEVDFSALPEGLAPILSFESKTQPDSPYWTDIRIDAARLPDAEQAHLAAACGRLFARLGLRDYGRFDFRCAADGSIRLMEVNPNPAWGYDAKLALMAGFAGWSYAGLIERLIATAWERVTADAAAR